MKANRAYRLIVSREGREPAFMADHGRTDRIELVSIADEEIALYWELPVRQAARLLKRLRGDLVALDADQFVARWEGADGIEDWSL